MPRLTYEGRPLDDDLVPIPTPVQIEAMLLESRRIAQEQARIKQGFRQPAHCRPLLSQPPRRRA